MKIKSYYSRTVEDAMAAARQEMGPDAMLVNRRKAPLEVRLRTWGWVFIAVLPLLFAVFKFSKSVIPVAAAICFSIVLPWCQHIWTDTYKLYDGSQYSYVRSEPNLAAHALVAAFAVFIIWWGVRQTSQVLVNLGIVGFAIAVGWFNFSDIM